LNFNFLFKSLFLGIIFLSINHLLLSEDPLSKSRLITTTSYTLFLNDMTQAACSDDLYVGIEAIFRIGEPGHYHYQSQVQSGLDPILQSDRNEESSQAPEATQASMARGGCMHVYSPIQNGNLTQHSSDLCGFGGDQHERSGLDSVLFLNTRTAEYYGAWISGFSSPLLSLHCFLQSNPSQEITQIDASLYSNQIRFSISQKEESLDCEKEEKTTSASSWDDPIEAIVLIGVITAGAWYWSPSCRKSDAPLIIEHSHLNYDSRDHEDSPQIKRKTTLEHALCSWRRLKSLRERFDCNEKADEEREASMFSKGSVSPYHLSRDKNPTQDPFGFLDFFVNEDERSGQTSLSATNQGLSGSRRSSAILIDSTSSSSKDEYSSQSVSFQTKKLSNPQFLEASKNFNSFLRKASRTLSTTDWNDCYEESILLLEHHQTILEDKADFQRFQASLYNDRPRPITHIENSYQEATKQEATKHVASWQQITHYCDAIHDLFFFRDEALKQNSEEAWNKLVKASNQAEELYSKSDLKMEQLFDDYSREEPIRDSKTTDRSTKGLVFFKPSRATSPVLATPCPINDFTSTFTLALLPYLKLRHEEFLCEKASSQDFALSYIDDVSMEEENESLFQELLEKKTALSNRWRKFQEEYPGHYTLYSSIEEQIVSKNKDRQSLIHSHSDEEESLQDDPFFPIEE